MKTSTQIIRPVNNINYKSPHKINNDKQLIIPHKNESLNYMTNSSYKIYDDWNNNGEYCYKTVIIDKNQTKFYYKAKFLFEDGLDMYIGKYVFQNEFGVEVEIENSINNVFFGYDEINIFGKVLKVVS